MRVGFYLLHPFWESMASGVRTLELARSLKKLGVDPIIFSPYEKTRLMSDGIQIVKVPTLFSTLGIEDTAYYLSRKLYYNRSMQKLVIKFSKQLFNGRFQSSSKLASFFGRFDLDILQAEQDNAALSLLSIKSKLDIPIVLDLHGIWPEELLAASAIEKDSADWKELQSLMSHVVNNVNLTISLSDAMRDYIVSNYGVKSSMTAVVPPGGRIMLDNYVERPAPIKVVYAGIISYRKHVDLFVKSMQYMKSMQSNVAFYITKKGDLLSRIQNLANLIQVTPEYFWYPDFDSTLKFLQSCHIGVHPSTNDTSARLSMPSKLFDYLSAGLPVVANDVGGWTEIIKKNRVGRVTSDDPKDFATNIIDLLNSPQEIADCARRSLALIKDKYNWDISANCLMREYMRLI